MLRTAPLVTLVTIYSAVTFVAAGLVLAGCDNGKRSTPNADAVDTRSAGTHDADGVSPGDVVDAQDATFGLDTRPANQTCVAPPCPLRTGDIDLERVYPSISFTKPIAALQAPGDAGRWFVVEQPGRVVAFDNRPDATQLDTVIDLTGVVDDGPNEAGLLGMAFHPDFQSNGYVFLSYTHSQAGALTSRIARLTSSDAGASFDLASEAVILELEQPYGNHNGGHITFGPDGYLYIGFGDGGSGGDPLGSGQDTSTLLGAMLRIDIDGTSPYAIPADNPFAQGGGAAELYAWGLRNPWRFNFDTATGALWAGDVGQNAWEEVDRIELGGNYGWNVREATHCFQSTPCDGPYIDPIVEHDQADGERSITGGFVYRGLSIPWLFGTYVYGDFVSGRMFGVAYDPTTGEPSPRLLLEAQLPIASFAQDLDGELYVVDYSGALHRLVASSTVPDTFPATLSATGCVQPTDPSRFADSVIPYEVNAPLWSDGASKARGMALPDGATIHVEDDGDWSLPAGTVLLEHLLRNGVPLETRLLIHHDDGVWAGYTYGWRGDRSGADLVRGGAMVSVGGELWTIPSESDCQRCHTRPAGSTLGLETAQLNRDAVYASTSRRAPQLATLDHIGVFDAAIGAPATLPALSDPYGDGPLDERARAYLHVNCSQCHRPGGPTPVAIDMRHTTAFADMGACDALSLTMRDLGLTDPRVLAPGAPERSLIVARMGRRDAERMPPLGTALVDDAGVALLSQWITELTACP